MTPFRAADYSPAIAEILSLAGGGLQPMPLVFGACVSSKARSLLQGLECVELFAPRNVVAVDFAEAAQSGLYVYLSCMDQAHAIAQEIRTPTGSYWHGILHRMEPDFSNARYWFRQVRQHEIFPALREAVIEIAGNPMPEFKVKPRWDAGRFIDHCEGVHKRPNPDLEPILLEIQLAEWQLLFDFCCRKALGCPLGVE